MDKIAITVNFPETTWNICSMINGEQKMKRKQDEKQYVKEKGF